jgi:hypothetical protein
MPNHNKPIGGFNANPQNINRNGPPKREWTWDGLMEKYAELEDEAGKGKQKDAVVKTVFKLARKGDMAAIKEIMNRMDGMPKQSVDMSTLGEKINNVIVLPEQELNDKRMDSASGTAD